MIRTVLLALATFGLCYIFNTSLKIGDTSAPPLGSFLSPFHGFWQNAESVDAPDDIVLDSTGVKSSVEVIYDERLVPHIFGSDLADVLFVQGYLHAKHRLWQMDISTRSAAGRLSEIMGEDLIDNDLNQRRQGMLYAAENANRGWSKFSDEYQLLKRYADGVNAYINQLTPKDYPLEFKLIGYAPEEWTTLHSALFMKNMAMTLCSGYSDVENTNLLNHFGQEVFDYLFPEDNPKQSPIIPESVDWDFEPVNASVESEIETDIGYLKTGMPSKFQKGIGSNNWAVSGAKTKSGNPILCGDPHLNLTLPSIWYEVQLHVDDINSYGVSLPGIPGVIIGFNENIAWTETNVGHDVWDFYKIEWTDEKKSKYKFKGEEREVRYRIEEIKVKGGKTILDTLKITELGIVNKYENGKEYEDLAFDWLAHHEPDKSELAAFLQINRATNHDEFQRALENYIAPAQNFAFASRDGDIAIHVNGSLPVKDDQAGRFVADGSKGSNWQGFIPRAHIPRVLNPERGFVSSANQHSTAQDYPYYYNSGYFENYRGRILNDKLASMDDITPQDMMSLHYDATSYKAKEALPIMLELVSKKDLDQFENEVLTSLSSWDFEYDPEEEACSYFDNWWSNIYRNTFDEITALRDEMDVRYPASAVLVRMLEDDKVSEFFDIDSTSQIEDASAIVQLSFDQAISRLKERKVKTSLEWHNYRKKSINHLARIDALSRKNIKAPGHGDALNAYGSTAGPSWRMVVSMDDRVTAKVIYPGGQEGNPGSKYYDDMIDSWVSGKYYDAHFASEKTELEDYQLYKITFK